MTIKPSFDDLASWLAAKPGGYFTGERWGDGWALTIHRVGFPPHTVILKTEAEWNRARMHLSDMGFTGYRSGGA